MAQAKNEAEGKKSQAEAPAVDAAVDSPRSYSKARLIAESRAFLGEPSHVVAGALSSADGDLTVSEARALVESFKTRVIA